MALNRMIYRMKEKDHSLFLVDPENLARAAGAVIQIFHALPQDAMLCSVTDGLRMLLCFLCLGKDSLRQG